MHFRRQQCRSQALKPQRAASYKVHQIGILSAEFLINAAINKRKCSVGHSCEAIWTSFSPTAPSALLYASQVGAHYIVWISVQYTEACQKLTRCISQMKYLSVWRACVSRSPITPLAPPSPRRNPDFHPLYFPRHDIALGRGIKTVRISDAVGKIISQWWKTALLRLTMELNAARKASAVAVTERDKKNCSNKKESDALLKW